MGVETIPEDRPASADEAAITQWVLQNASQAGDLSDLEPSLLGLRVVGRCSCGCPSVDFVAGGQALGAAPVANAHGTTAEGVAVGVILWERDGAVSALEFYQLGEPVCSLPLVESLVAWPPPSDAANSV
jgi:hypothetical protein